MCGIAGFYNLQRQQVPLDDALLTRLHQKMAHRGPDAAGFWKSEEAGLALVSCRLSVVGLSALGNQPMFDERRELIIVFNGEIYNYREVQPELEKLGYVFTTGTDTEIILASYRAWGIACLDKLNGQFAFVLYDLRDQSMYLVRDRIGVKPLYFSLRSGMISFASEIKVLWELPWLEKKISPLAWYHYLTFMVTPAPMTIFEGIYKMPAGFYAKVDATKRVSFHQWYTPLKTLSAPEQREMQSEAFCIERIQQLLDASVQRRMVADVPVGAYLSGGLDSSLNVALMSRYSKNIKTFTIAFSDNPDYNELTWARKVAKHFGTDHHELVISEHEAFAYYEQMVSQLDEPLADVVCIPFYYVSKLARSMGMKVVQVGEGADELFFGYPSYGHYAQLYNRVWKPSHMVLPAVMRRGIAGMMQPFVAQQPLRSDLLHNWSHDRNLFWGGAIAFSEAQKRQHLGDMRHQLLEKDYVVDQIYPGMSQAFDSHAIVDYHLKQLLAHDPQADFGKQMLYLELKQRLPELLLMRADKMAMAESIEAREPFLDYHLVEFMLNVPTHLKFKNNVTKYLLKKAAEEVLPHEIIYRKKVGFGAPLAQWFIKGELFPAYFDRLAYRAHDAPRGEFATPFWQVDETMNSNAGHRAVQNWVLQQLWAFSQQT